MEDEGVNPAVWFIGALVLAFITATPGPLQATWDMYIVAPFKNLTTQSLRKKDVEVGRKLAQGGFGTVYVGRSGATIPGKIRKGQARISLLDYVICMFVIQLAAVDRPSTAQQDGTWAVLCPAVSC